MHPTLQLSIDWRKKVEFSHLKRHIREHLSRLFEDEQKETRKAVTYLDPTAKPSDRSRMTTTRQPGLRTTGQRKKICRFLTEEVTT